MRYASFVDGHLFMAQAVGTAANSARNDGPACVEDRAIPLKSKQFLTNDKV